MGRGLLARIYHQPDVGQIDHAMPHHTGSVGGGVRYLGACTPRVGTLRKYGPVCSTHAVEETSDVNPRL